MSSSTNPYRSSSSKNRKTPPRIYNAREQAKIARKEARAQQQWSNNGKVGTAKFVRDVHKVLHSKTAKQVTDTMKYADKNFYPLGESTTTELLESSIKSVGLTLAPATIQKMSNYATVALYVNHEALAGIRKVQKIDQAAKHHGVWDAVDRYIEKNQESENGFGSGTAPQYTIQPYPVPNSSSPMGPITAYTPRLLDISYMNSEAERITALKEIGFTLAPEFTSERELVVLTNTGQPIVIFRGTDINSPKDLNTDRKIIMGRSDADIRRVHKGQELIRKVGEAYGRNDTMALGHSLGGYIAQRSQAPGGVITYNKLSIGRDIPNPYGQHDYRTTGDFASLMRDTGAVPTTEFVGHHPLQAPRANHSDMGVFQNHLLAQQGPVGIGSQNPVLVRPDSQYLDGTKNMVVYPTL